MPNFNEIFQQVAQNHHVTVEEVYREMQAAIDEAYASPDPAVQAEWKKVPCPHGKPRPEDLIAYCCK